MKTTKLKVRKIGNSLGVILSKEAAEVLQVEEGASLYMTETPAGITLKAGDDKFNEAMRIVDDLSKRYRNALRELAK